MIDFGHDEFQVVARVSVNDPRQSGLNLGFQRLQFATKVRLDIFGILFHSHLRVERVYITSLEVSSVSVNSNVLAVEFCPYSLMQIVEKIKRLVRVRWVERLLLDQTGEAVVTQQIIQDTCLLFSDLIERSVRLNETKNILRNQKRIWWV